MRKDAHAVLYIDVAHGERPIVALRHLVYDRSGVDTAATANRHHRHASTRPALGAYVADAERHEIAGAATSAEEKWTLSILTEETFPNRLSNIVSSGFVHVPRFTGVFGRNPTNR